MALNIPQEFKPYAKYLNVGLAVESTNPVVGAMMKIFFYQTCEDIASQSQVSPQARQFLQRFGSTVPPEPGNGVAETQKYANDYYAYLTNLVSQNQWNPKMVKDFYNLALIYEILEGDQNEEKCTSCKAIAVKIKNMYQKQAEINKGKEGGANQPSGGPPVFTPQGSSGGPPVFTPQGSAGGPPVFTPNSGSSGGPPVFTPNSGSSGGPPVFTPQGNSSGGPPVFTPNSGSAGGPPVFTPQGSSAGGPPVFTPSSQPPGSAGGPPSYTPSQFKAPVDPNYDVNSASRLLQSLGYNIVSSSSLPPLTQQSYIMVDNYLEYAVKGIKDGDKDTCLSYLKEALDSWNSGGYA